SFAGLHYLLGPVLFALQGAWRAGLCAVLQRAASAHRRRAIYDRASAGAIFEATRRALPSRAVLGRHPDGHLGASLRRGPGRLLRGGVLVFAGLAAVVWREDR